MDTKASTAPSRLALTSSDTAIWPQRADSGLNDKPEPLSVGSRSFEASVTGTQGFRGLGLLSLQHNETEAAYTLDLTRSAVLSRVKSYSTIDLTGTANNSIKLNWAAVAILSSAFDASAPDGDAARVVVLSGNVGDVLHLVQRDSWAVESAKTAETLSDVGRGAYDFLPGHAYNAYSLFGVTVFVDQAMAVSDAPAKLHEAVTSQAFSIEALFGQLAAAPGGERKVDFEAHNTLVSSANEAVSNAVDGAANKAVDGPAIGTANKTPGHFDDTSSGFKGVAIVFAGTGGANGDVATVGHYELSKDGGNSWMPVAGDLNKAHAIYADKTAWLRYVGAEEIDRVQPQSLLVRLIDDSGLNGMPYHGVTTTGSTLDLSADGLVAAFGASAQQAWVSATQAQALVQVQAQAEAEAHADKLQGSELQPLGGLDFGAEPQGQVGSLVSSLVGSVVGGDRLAGHGIAITASDAVQGTLFYSTNGGGTWTEVTHPMGHNNTLLMRSDADNRVYFKPSAGVMAQNTDALTIRSWDQSQETASIFFITAGEGQPIQEPLAPEPVAHEPSIAKGERTLGQEGLTVEPPSDGAANAGQASTSTSTSTSALRLEDTQALNAPSAARGSEPMADIHVSPEDVKAAINASVIASMAKFYAMNRAESLGWDDALNQAALDNTGVSGQPSVDATVLSDPAFFEGVAQYGQSSLDGTLPWAQVSFDGMAQAAQANEDKASDSAAQQVSLSLADVLNMPATQGTHQLLLTGEAKDQLSLREGEWTDTGEVVVQNGHHYAVYSGSNDATAQLLIDQQQNGQTLS